jgi:hypothetical protein
MNQTTIKPEKITKPIQLLGAWLAGLFLIDACFLFAAANIKSGSWEPKALTIAAIVNVPLFLISVFVLQTRFRPELQEDSYYSTYLSSKTNQLITVSKEDAQFSAIFHRIYELEMKIRSVQNDGTISQNRVQELAFGVNKYLGDRAQISKKLSSHGIIDFTSFGGNEPPNGRSVAISKYLPKETIREVVKLAQELGFNSYDFMDGYAEEIIEDVLIGSYGVGDHQITG